MIDQLFNYPRHHPLETTLIQELQLQKGFYTLDNFPDGETYVRIDSPVSQGEVGILTDLANPNPKMPELLMLASTIRELGTSHITLIVPYLPYMRQDKQFRPGEGITSKYFARYLGLIADQLITVEPHLHRWESLDALYPIPAKALQTDEILAHYLKTNFTEKLILVGPDEESEQWVSRVSAQSGIPYRVLKKARYSSDSVSLTYEGPIPEKHIRPVILDDIVSTAGTMETCVKFLVEQGFPNPVCLTIHALMDEKAVSKLKAAGAYLVISTNTVKHKTNAIDIAPVMLNFLAQHGS